VIESPPDHLRRGEGPSQHFWMMPKPKRPKQPLSSTPTIIFYQSRHRRPRRGIEHSSHSKWGGCLASVCFMHPHASGRLSVVHLASMGKDKGIPKGVRFSSRKFQDSRVIAAAYDTRIFDLSSPAKDSGQICDTYRVIGIGGQSTLELLRWKNFRDTLPQQPEIHRAG
jgi:hypothetical protein